MAEPRREPAAAPGSPNEWLTNPVVEASLSTSVLASLTITLVVVAFAVWLAGSVSAIRTTDRWKPEAE